MRKPGFPLFIAFFSVAILNAQFAPAPKARLVIRSGLVEVQRGDVWLPIAIGELLNAGERVRTASGSTAALEIGPGKVVTLNELSAVQIGKSGQNSSPAAVQLESGSMKVFSTSDIQVTAKDTVLESAGSTVDLE